MKNKIILTIIFSSITLFGAEFAIVADKNFQLDSLNAKQTKDIFLMKRQFVKGVKVVPVNASATSKQRDVFEKMFLKMPRHRLTKYWTKMHFQGVRPPIVQASSKSIQLFVKNVEGALGYVPKSEIDATVKVLYEF